MTSLNYAREWRRRNLRWLLPTLIAVIVGTIMVLFLPVALRYAADLRFERLMSRCAAETGNEQPLDTVAFATKKDIVGALAQSSGYKVIPLHRDRRGVANVPADWSNLRSSMSAQQVTPGHAAFQHPFANLYLGVWTLDDGSQALVSIDLLFESQAGRAFSTLISTVVPLGGRSAKSAKSHYIGTFEPFHAASDLIIYRGTKPPDREEVGINWSTEGHVYQMRLKLDHFSQLDDRFHLEEWKERQSEKTGDDPAPPIGR